MKIYVLICIACHEYVLCVFFWWIVSPLLPYDVYVVSPVCITCFPNSCSFTDLISRILLRFIRLNELSFFNWCYSFSTFDAMLYLSVKLSVCVQLGCRLIVSVECHVFPLCIFVFYFDSVYGYGFWLSVMCYCR